MTQKPQPHTILNPTLSIVKNQVGLLMQNDYSVICSELDKKSPKKGQIIGKSIAMMAVFATLSFVAGDKISQTLPTSKADNQIQKVSFENFLWQQLYGFGFTSASVYFLFIVYGFFYHDDQSSLGRRTQIGITNRQRPDLASFHTLNEALHVCKQINIAIYGFSGLNLLLLIYSIILFTPAAATLGVTTCLFLQRLLVLNVEKNIKTKKSALRLSKILKETSEDQSSD
ncbi:MAG: hypothetical protein ACRCXZ_04620 [Patescibacteria group bacterium]